MQLNHFADAFQNDHASVDQFFSASNNLTEQFSPGYGGAGTGFGFAQNPAGYEWAGGVSDAQVPDSLGQPQEFRGNGGYHSQLPSYGTCGGGDPQALARANLEWENYHQGQHMPGEPGYPHTGPVEHCGRGQYAAEAQAQVGSKGQAEEEYVYSGPDDLEYDDDEVAPKKGSGYWKRRMPTAVIHIITVLLWVWVWSNFGFSKLLGGTAGSILYWGFIVFMMIGITQSDHRAALYAEEREQLTSIEGSLKTIVRVVALVATLLLSFDVLKKRSQGEQTAVFSALGIAFFVSLVGMASFTSKKRGEHVRRHRKIKGAALNLSIALMAAAALMSFGMGGKQSGGGNVEVVMTGGAGDKVTTAKADKKGAAKETGATRVIKVKSPPEDIRVEVEPSPPKVTYQSSGGGGGGYGPIGGGGAPTVISTPPAPAYGGAAVSPTIPQAGGYGGYGYEY